MYRILAAQGEVAERRRQRRHPVYQKPELLAEAPNQVRSWDISKLMGPVKWSYFYLYVILDIFSSRVVGWRVEHAESATLFKALFSDAMAKHAVPMKAKATALMLADLGVVKSHSRPHTSNDNPFSEAHFKTLKYLPEFPKRFETIDAARIFCRRFFAWYDENHHHGRPSSRRHRADDARSDPRRASPHHPCRPLKRLMLRSQARRSGSSASAQNHHKSRQLSGSTRQSKRSQPMPKLKTKMSQSR